MRPGATTRSIAERHIRQLVLGLDSTPQQNVRVRRACLPCSSEASVESRRSSASTEPRLCVPDPGELGDRLRHQRRGQVLDRVRQVESVGLAWRRWDQASHHDRSSRRTHHGIRSRCPGWFGCWLVNDQRSLCLERLPPGVVNHYPGGCVGEHLAGLRLAHSHATHRTPITSTRTLTPTHSREPSQANYATHWHPGGACRRLRRRPGCAAARPIHRCGQRDRK